MKLLEAEVTVGVKVCAILMVRALCIYDLIWFYFVCYVCSGHACFCVCVWDEGM